MKFNHNHAKPDCILKLNSITLSAHSQFDFFQHLQNRLPRCPNIQPHKPAAFLAELYAGIQTYTGLVNEEVLQFGVGQVHGAAVEP